MFKTLLRSRLFVATALLTAACSPGAGGEDLAGEVTATEAAALESGLTAGALAAIDSPDPGAAAQAVAVAADPESCRTRVRDAELPNVVHVYLQGCTGRLGRHVIDGEMRVTFSPNADGSLHSEHESVSLTIDGREASRVASADITFEGDVRHVVWHGETTSTLPSGESVTHTGSHLVDVDRATRCRTVNGTGTTLRGDQEIHSVLTDVTACAAPDGGDYCPTGTIEHENLTRGRHVTKTLDGSDTVVVEISGPRGERTRTIELACTPAP